jgi:DNA-binding Lrp family transcriptional regulator
MIRAFVFIEAEPGRVQDLVQELAGMQLDNSVIKEVHAVTGHYDLIALIESPDVAALGD